jgi:hypothetical protein
MTGKITNSTLTVNGTRCGINISTGPWTEGVNPALIKVRPKRNSFPASVIEGLRDVYENNSDMREDYFECGCLRLLPGHPLYNQAKLAAGA